MKVVVTANGTHLDAPTSPVFGRCPTYVFVDTETMQFEAVENPSVASAGGAGIQAAQFVIERGAQAAITGNVGPNAFDVLAAAGVPVYLFGGGTVREAVEAFKAGQLSAAGAASTPAHAGMGMGMGMGRGMRMGRGMGVSPMQPPASAASSREEEIAELREMTSNLRKQLAEVLERLDRLEKGGR